MTITYSFIRKDLQLFADGAVHGLIIFTLGSNSKVSLMPKHIQKIFLDVFARLPQRVVWKWEKESDSTIPPNVKLVDWLPQQDLLGKISSFCMTSTYFQPYYDF